MGSHQIVQFMLTNTDVHMSICGDQMVLWTEDCGSYILWLHALGTLKCCALYRITLRRLQAVNSPSASC